MSEEDDFIPLDSNQDSAIDSKIAESLNLLVNGILNITEYNEKELKAISILSTDPRLNKYLEVFKSNKKHIKRKHSTEILKALKTIAISIGRTENSNDMSSMNDRQFFNRRK